MPTLTTTVEDNSPLILYSSGWQTGTSASDQLLDLYSGNDFTYTTTAGNTASLTFNGTGVTFYGAKRWNHGLFQGRVDNVQYPSQNGSQPDPGSFQIPLFQATNLTQGLHTVILEYVGPTNSLLDLDFITWQGNVGETQGDRLYVYPFKDTHSAFEYDSSWSSNVTDAGRFSGGTGHVTSTPGSSVTFTFKGKAYMLAKDQCHLPWPPGGTGDGVALYGPVSPTGSAYTIQLDNGGIQAFNSNQPHYRPQMLMYQATNLGSGTHRIVMTYPLTAPTSQYLAVDYANVYTTIESNAGTVTPTTTVSGGGLSTGVVAGAAVGSFAAGVLAVAALAFFFLRRRQSQEKQIKEKLLATPFDREPLDHANRLAPVASNSNLQSHPQPAVFVSGGEIRKEQLTHRFNPQPGLGGASSSSLPEPRFADPHASGSNSIETTPEASPPDYAQAMTRLRDGWTPAG